MQNKAKKLNFENQNIYIGIDTHLKDMKLTILTEQLEHKTISMDPNAQVVSNYLFRHFPGANYYSAYEASFSGFKLHRELLSLGIENIVVNPADIPTTNKQKVQKEDKRDSRKIAHMLRANTLDGIYIPSEEMQELRMLIRYRKQLAREIGKNKNRVKSYLYFLGIEISIEMSSASRHWSKKFTSWVKGLNLKTDEGRLVMDSLVDATEDLRKQLLRINRAIRELSRTGEHSKMLGYLMSIPGVGLVTAATILTEIEDIFRFKTEDQLCSFVGIIPSTNSSGEKESVGRITKRSNKSLRPMIIEASWIASRRDPALAYCFNEYCKRMERNKAIIRIAKKLVKRIRYVMKNETEYVCSVL
jgi:transposase